MSDLILAGDIGGTKTLLQLARVEDGACRPIWEARFDSAAHDDFAILVERFLGDARAHVPAGCALRAACFGVAGPIEGRRAKVTNLPWSVDADALGAEFGIPAVALVNDFAAVGHGIEALAGDDLETLQAGEEEPRGTRAVLGAGTGLGEGILVWSDGRYRALPSEGGHADFAPTDEEQIGLLRHLQPLYGGHVSYERILSGDGLVTIFRYLTDTGAEAATLGLLGAMEAEDPASAISRHALAGTDPAAVHALDMFVAIYGAQAGNLALTLLPRGGVYVAGGIAPKIIAKLRKGAFMRAFRDKGRFAGLLATVPVRVVMNPKVGLMGAAVVAARL